MVGGFLKLVGSVVNCSWYMWRYQNGCILVVVFVVFVCFGLWYDVNDFV